MRILVILPVLGEANSIRHLLTSLQVEKIKVLTSRSGGEKSRKALVDYEILDGLEIHRITPHYNDFSGWRRGIIANRDKIIDFKPDIIFFGTWHLRKVASNINKYTTTKAKLICLTEYYSNLERFIGYRRYYLGLPFLKRLVASVIKLRLLLSCKMILCSDLLENENKRLRVLPWCNQIENLGELIPYAHRRNTFVFAGSLTGLTINSSFFEMLNFLLLKFPHYQCDIIGDGIKRPQIEEFAKDYSNRIRLHGQLKRDDVLKIIGNSKYAILATREGGWGFIGECFALGTPIIVSSNHYRFNLNIDSFVFRDIETDMSILLNAIGQYDSNSQASRNRYLQDHSKNAVSRKLNQYFLEVYDA